MNHIDHIFILKKAEIPNPTAEIRISHQKALAFYFNQE